MSKQQNLPRLMLVATGSGSGKTTLTCGILKALTNRKLVVASFKCGPDYIDPMFHSKIIRTKSRNLDVVMCGEETVKFLMAKNAADCDLSLVEGVMGMYDGVGFDSEYGSSNHISQLTATPQILVVNVKGMSLSVAAIISGFIGYKQNNIKGILLNHCSKAMYPFYKKIIEAELDIPVYGYLPFIREATVESRHLGLITADEIDDIHQRLDLLAQTVEESVDIDGLISLANSAKPLDYNDMWQDIQPDTSFKIAVARDSAFCFFYEDNFDLLKKMGGEIVYFSPILDEKLPEDIDGLLLYGGYPEEHAEVLSKNKTMRDSIKKALANKLPTIAECGGFMYLLDMITDRNGVSHEMVGHLKGTAAMTKKLTRFGYLTLTARVDNLLCRAGESINSHEFHYSDSNNNGEGFTASKRMKEWGCIHVTESLFAGYPHLHFGSNADFAVNFAEKCREYQQKRRGTDDTD